ncbi:hypothetical protein ACVWW1_008443 [Bradyrhizobium sp. JR3.5]
MYWSSPTPDAVASILTSAAREVTDLEYFGRVLAAPSESAALFKRTKQQNWLMQKQKGDPWRGQIQLRRFCLKPTEKSGLCRSTGRIVATR